MENPIKTDDLGGKPTIFGNTHIHPMNINMEPKHEGLEDFCSSSKDSFERVPC